MAEIKAIETYYNGYRFRSRLEARWAVFFDTLGIEYQYEPEGYELNDGTRYLPDFYLPDFQCFAEVKPYILERLQEYVKQGIEFVKSVNEPILYCFDFNVQEVMLACYTETEEKGVFPSWFASTFIPGTNGCKLLSSKVSNDDTEFEPVYRNSDKQPFKKVLNFVDLIKTDPIIAKDIIVSSIVGVSIKGFPRWKDIKDAVNNAKSARFEYGEKGEPQKQFSAVYGKH